MTNVTTPRARITLDDDSDQSIPPRTWTRLRVESQDAFVFVDGLYDVDLQLYPVDLAAAARPKTWQTIIRRLDGTKDGNVTGRDPRPWPAITNATVRYVNVNLDVDPGRPLTFDVYHDAPGAIVLTKRVLKVYPKRLD